MPAYFRSSMAAEPYARLIAEMRKLNVAEISSVETLSTSVDLDAHCAFWNSFGYDLRGVLD